MSSLLDKKLIFNDILAGIYKYGNISSIFDFISSSLLTIIDFNSINFFLITKSDMASSYIFKDGKSTCIENNIDFNHEPFLNLVTEDNATHLYINK